MNEKIEQNRLFMQCPLFRASMKESDQKKGILPPPHNVCRGGEKIVLPSFENLGKSCYMELLDNRRSVREFTDTPMKAEELGFLLWSGGGVQKYRDEAGHFTLRPVPSGGARHPFELYCAVRNVEGLEPGLYHYLPIENVGEKKVTLEYMGAIEDYSNTITEMLADQSWAAKAPAVIMVSCVPYRGEWRYTEASHRVMLIDLGHIGQNLMLSAQALGLGSCCIAAYNQQVCDDVLGLDSINEYTVYGLPVGSGK